MPAFAGMTNYDTVSEGGGMGWGTDSLRLNEKVAGFEFRVKNAPGCRLQVAGFNDSI